MNRHRNRLIRIVVTSLLMIGWCCLHPLQVRAQENANRTGPHGGVVVNLGFGHGELLATSHSTRLYLYSPEGRPIALSTERAQMAFRLPEERKRRWYDLYPGRDQKTGETFLQARVDLTEVLLESFSGDLCVQSNNSSSPIQNVTCQIPIQRTAEEVAILAQNFCPVSQRPLKLGKRVVKQTVEGETVFFCCAECIDDYVSQDHHAQRSTKPVKATKADATALNRQRLCPVMEEPLDAMGGPWKIIVQGKPVYVCCEGCIESVQDEPEAYLARTRELNQQSERK